MSPTKSDSRLETEDQPGGLGPAAVSGDPTARPEAAPGQVVSHYRVFERLGGGAMGVVYRAEDTRLRRSVALKFLPWEWSDDPSAKRRFTQEARAASSLDHPNICTVYEIDETDEGRLFIAMALCQGETLKQRIRRGGLSWDRVVDYGAQIANGLAAAHEKGIIHRDLKPANVYVTQDGVAKILDFGLAVVAGETRLTRAGGTVGTPAYMSPEQALGQAVSPRSDLWSLGVILYEMLTGRRPFEGDHAQGVIYSILNEQPLPPSAHQPGLPAGLVDLILQALAKRSEERPGNAQEMADRLTRLRTDAADTELDRRRRPREEAAPSGIGRSRFARAWRALRTRTAGALAALTLAVAIAAVVWWPDNSPRGTPRSAMERPRIGILAPQLGEGQDHLADWPGLVQMLYASQLTGVPQLAVVDPLSLNDRIESSHQRDRSARSRELRQILEPFSLSYLVEGVILETAEGRRLVSSLLDAATGEVLAMSTDLVDSEKALMAVVQEVSREILDYLQLRIEGMAESEDFQPWVSLHQHDLEAIKAFLNANRYIYRLQPGAATYLRRAIEIDPDFIAARLWLISSLVQNDELNEAREHLRYLRSHEAKASPFERAMIGWADSFIEHDLAREAHQLEIALDFSPGNNILLQNLAIVRYELGDLLGAAEAIEPAVEMGWSYPDAYVMQARCQILLERWGEARETLEKALGKPSPAPEIYAWLHAFAILDGDREAAKGFERQHTERLESLALGREDLDLGPVYAKLAERARALARPEVEEELLSLAEQAASAAGTENDGSGGGE